MTMAIASPDTVTQAAALLRAGKLVAFPTETVYGLGADATDGAAVARVYAAKGRPTFNPLIVHVAEARWVAGMALPDGRFDKLARTFWPGPLTLIMRRRPDTTVAALASAGLDTIAVRAPDHPVALDILRAAATQGGEALHLDDALDEDSESRWFSLAKRRARDGRPGGRLAGDRRQGARGSRIARGQGDSVKIGE